VVIEVLRGRKAIVHARGGIAIDATTGLRVWTLN
jgi:hypothetical protein